ncbi:hypothetical protein CYMTET_13758, partial [Cymbomonas tetramitiformis]
DLQDILLLSAERAAVEHGPEDPTVVGLRENIEDLFEDYPEWCPVEVLHQETGTASCSTLVTVDLLVSAPGEGEEVNIVEVRLDVQCSGVA